MEHSKQPLYCNIYCVIFYKVTSNRLRFKQAVIKPFYPITMTNMSSAKPTFIKSYLLSNNWRMSCSFCHFIGWRQFKWCIGNKCQVIKMISDCEARNHCWLTEPRVYIANIATPSIYLMNNASPCHCLWIVNKKINSQKRGFM